MLPQLSIIPDIEKLPDYRLFGRVSGIVGMLLEMAGLDSELSIGSRCRVHARGGRSVYCEVIGFRGGHALLLPFGSLEGVGLGCKVDLLTGGPSVFPSTAWLGRVVNALGEPVDGKGVLLSGQLAYALHASPPPAHSRKRVGAKLDLGIKAINTFLTCCDGQRMGIFAGSGVGKSILLSMLARYADADVNVIGLIGERGREVQEWLEEQLGPEGLARSVVVVATSDESPLMRRQAAYLTLTVAEFFRDRGKKVFCLMDSVTRFAMAMREIGLAAGEPPAAKGYTPSVFSELPKLLERAGPGQGDGSITGLFTVLVEGDDHNEPISDSVRGILDGHIVLDRKIAERNRYPAIDLLKSISRTMPACNSERENALITRARQLLSTYEDMAELIRLGAYKRGSDPTVDEAIHYYPLLEAFIAQRIEERFGLEACYGELAQILGVDWPVVAVPTKQPVASEEKEGTKAIGVPSAGAPLKPTGQPELKAPKPDDTPVLADTQAPVATPSAQVEAQKKPLRVRQMSAEDRRRKMAAALNIDPKELDGGNEVAGKGDPAGET